MSGVLKYTLVVQHPDSLTAVALLAGKPVPEWAEDLVHEDDYEVQALAGSEVEGDEEVSVDGVKPPTLAELKTEIALRNEGRDEADQIKPAGTKKADLIDALAADQQS